MSTASICCAACARRRERIRPIDCWNSREVARRFNVSRQLVERQATAGLLDAITIDGRRWFRVEDVQTWIAARSS
jgi:hypothetical protein